MVSDMQVDRSEDIAEVNHGSIGKSQLTEMFVAKIEEQKRIWYWRLDLPAIFPGGKVDGGGIQGRF